MKRIVTIVACAVAVILTGCTGHIGSAPPVPQASSTLSSRAAQSPFTFVTHDGRIVHYAPTRSRLNRAGHSQFLNPSFSLSYYGGPVQHSPKVYVVFWGKIWKSRKGDPDSARKDLLSFLNALHGSQWLNILTQYYDPNGNILDDTAFGGSYIDETSQLPPQPSDQLIGYEAGLAANHFGDYSADASYVVAMPHGHNPADFGLAYCSYHTYTPTFGGLTSYTALPYIPDAGQTCGAGSVNKPGTLDGVSIFEGHEQAEVETDPQPFTGWFGVYQFEVADVCEFQNLQNTQFGRKTFPTQPLWSNQDNACVQ